MKKKTEEISQRAAYNGISSSAVKGLDKSVRYIQRSRLEGNGPKVSSPVLACIRLLLPVYLPK